MENLDRLSKGMWHIKLYLRQGYNQVKIAKGEKWETAFHTRYSNFKCRVIPFVLTNTSATFQHFTNDCICDYLDIFCAAYLDVYLCILKI